MRTTELIKLMPTQFKRVPDNPLYTGHFIPKLGEWTRDGGWVQTQELEYENETLSCPIIAIVEEKIGNADLELIIIGKQSEYWMTTELIDGDYTLERKTYRDAGTTIDGTLTIPRFTRPWATFVITGLGQNIWAIQNIITTVTECEVGKISFYALASNGSKLIYWYGIHMLSEELRSILRPWIAPSTCSRCSGTGIEPDTVATTCCQCLGYKYSGYSSTKWVQRQIGADVGLAREVLDWGDLTQADHDLIRKFINKAWTQKWWVTPTVTDIKRLFAHFYDVELEDIRITERFNAQEPVWDIFLPRRGSIASPFSDAIFDEVADVELMEYIAESVTPAGVSVFVGFYRDFIFGNMDDIDNDSLFIIAGGPPLTLHEHSSIDGEWEKWMFTPRFEFFNGWTIATDDFERDVGPLTGWDTFGTVEIINANDQNRHMAKLDGSAYMETGVADLTGSFELWVHPIDEIRIGMRSGVGWLFFVDFDIDAWVDSNLNILDATPDNDYHIRVDYDHTSELFDLYIQQNLVSSGGSYLISGPVSKFRITHTGIEDVFVDGYGNTEDPSYSVGDNLARQAEFGTGISNRYGYTEGIGRLYHGSPDCFNLQNIGDQNAAQINWVDAEAYQGSGYSEIIAGVGGHAKVLELYQDGTVGSNIIRHTFPGGVETSGIREFWWGTDDVTSISDVVIRRITSNHILLRLDNTFQEYSGGGYNVIAGAPTPVNNRMYHFKIEYDCSTDTYNLWINRVQVLTDHPFALVATDIDNIVIASGTTAVYSIYFDAFGDPTDPDYDEGQNLNGFGDYRIQYARHDRFIDYNQFTANCQISEL